MNSALGLRGWIAVGVAAAAVLATAFIALSAVRRANRRELCLWNCSRIGMTILAAESHASGWESVGTGRRFFEDVARWPGRKPFPMEAAWFCCPLVGRPEAGRIDYRGPAGPLTRFASEDPVAADRPGNHGSDGGGSVVLRNGGVRTLDETDPGWIRAATTTTDRAE